jgi:2-methylcitrate dehydratase PrpD
MIDGLIELITDARIEPHLVSAVAVRVSPPAARFTDLLHPKTRMQAKFSIRHCAAAAVIFRRVGTSELDESVLTRADVVDLRDRVKLVADPALGKQEADVEILLTDGRTLTAQVRGNRGTPAAPLTDADLSDKFRTLVEPVLGPERTGKLLQACWGVDELRDVSVLLALTVP